MHILDLCTYEIAPQGIRVEEIERPYCEQAQNENALGKEVRGTCSRKFFADSQSRKIL